MGEKDKSKRCCIYCGNKGEKNFIEKAHAIPEALGNEVIQNEECDECNSYFAKNIEEDFTNFLSFPRVIYGIDGKNGKPTMEYNDAEIAAKYLDFSKTELDWGRFNGVKEIAKDMSKYKGAVILDEANSVTNAGLNLVNIKAVKPINIYRTLCKSVIGVVDNKIRKNFKETIKWLRYDQHKDEKLPMISVCSNARICKTPQLMIYIKNNEKTELPYCFADFRIANFSFLFVIPFVDKDAVNFADRENYENFLNSLKWIKKECYTMLDFSSSEGVNIRNILNFQMFKPSVD